MPQSFPFRQMVGLSLFFCSSCAQLEPRDLPQTVTPTRVRPAANLWKLTAPREGKLKSVGGASTPKQLATYSSTPEPSDSLPVLATAPPAEAEDINNQSKTDSETKENEHANDSVPADLANGEGMTLAKLEQLALENNPTLRQAGFLVQQAEGNWIQVGLYPNPVVGYQGEEMNDEGTAGKQGVFINQTIVTADKLDWNRSAASWDIEQSRWQAEAQRWAVINHVRVQYYAVLAAQRTIEVAEELLTVVQQGLQAAGELQKGGQVPETDVLQAKLELNAMQIILRSARRQEAGARRELAALLGIPELPAEPLAGQLDHEMPEIEYELEWQRIATSSPALKFAQAQVEQAKAQLQREIVEPIPDVQVQANALNDYAADQDVYGLQLGIALPILNRNQGNISAAHAALHQAIENVQRLELSLRHQLAQAVQRYEVAQAQVRLYREEILPTAQEALQLTTQGYRAGQVDFLRVLTVRRTYIENQVNYILALQELKAAYVHIEGLLLTGALNNPTQVLGQLGGRGGGSNGAISSRPLTMTPNTNAQ